MRQTGGGKHLTRGCTQAFVATRTYGAQPASAGAGALPALLLAGCVMALLTVLTSRYRSRKTVEVALECVPVWLYMPCHLFFPCGHWTWRAIPAKKGESGCIFPAAPSLLRVVRRWSGVHLCASPRISSALVGFFLPLKHHSVADASCGLLQGARARAAHGL